MIDEGADEGVVGEESGDDDDVDGIAVEEEREGGWRGVSWDATWMVVEKVDSRVIIHVYKGRERDSKDGD